MKTNANTTYMLKRLLVVWCLGLAMPTQAQNILSDKIQWNTSTLTDLNHNKTESSTTCQFVTSGNQINWVQGSGSYIVSFTMTGTSGAWSDLTKPGSVNFSVISGALTGTITFSKDTSGTSIKLVLSGGTNPISILYTISTFEKL
jgi:hypothetical protein